MSEAAIMRKAEIQGGVQTTLLRTRAGAAAGLIGIVVSTIGYNLHGDFPMGKSGAEIVKWATTTNQTSFAVGIYVEIVGFLLFLLFAAWVGSLTREAEGGSGWLSPAAFAGAVLLVGLAALDNGLWVSLLNGARHGTGLQTLRTLRDGAEQIW